MEITELQAYKKLKDSFEKKGYSQGNQDYLPVYHHYSIYEKRFLRDIYDLNTDIPFSWFCNPKPLKPNQYISAYVYAIENGEIKFEDIPEEYLTRKFFLHTTSSVHEDIVEYIKEHPEKFDKQFFKDHIETNYYNLEFKLNDFEYMPLDYIDEELVACAMFKSIDMRYSERSDCDDWFYSVYRRKPEVLTQELYILGARCFSQKLHKENHFLNITPKEYQTAEFYLALCLNKAIVTEDIPENILTNDFLIVLLNDSPENIRCFSESALEREVEITGKGIFKFWQIAIIKDGYQIANLPLNKERIEFFLSIYGKNSNEFDYGLKKNYNL